MADSLYTVIATGKVLAARVPRSSQDFAELKHAGVTLLVNLREEPDPVEQVERHGMRLDHRPVPDFTAPSQDVLQSVVEDMNKEIGWGGIVAVHCHAGLGRTGTVVAAWLVHGGASPAEALAKVRFLRPGSVETDEQVAAVHSYAEWLSKRNPGPERQ